MIRRRSAPLTFVFWSLIASTASWGQSSPGLLQLQPGALIDPSSDRVFLMVPDGGVESLSVTSGETLWRSTEAHKPVTLLGDTLIAQVDSLDPGRLDVAFMDAETGQVTRRRDTPLPTDVRARIDHDLRFTFDLAPADLRSPGRLAWRFVGQSGRGMPGGPEPDRREGQLEVDRSTATITSVTGRAPAPLPVLEEMPRPPRSAERRFRNPGQGIELVSTLTGQDGVMPRYRWRIEDNGRVLGETDSPVSATAFAVVGDVLIHLVPPYNQFEGGREVIHGMTVRAVNLASGEVLWERELRDVRYTGPFPV